MTRRQFAFYYNKSFEKRISKKTFYFSKKKTTIELGYSTDTGVCKTRTGYLRMADADGKMRIEKCG